MVDMVWRSSVVMWWRRRWRWSVVCVLVMRRRRRLLLLLPALLLTLRLLRVCVSFGTDVQQPTAACSRPVGICAVSLRVLSAIRCRRVSRVLVVMVTFLLFNGWRRRSGDSRGGVVRVLVQLMVLVLVVLVVVVMRMVVWCGRWHSSRRKSNAVIWR